MNTAPGRNDPCPCRSNRKFKKCCGDVRKQQERAEASKLQATILLERKRCEELQRQKQQGLGRPIISTQHAGHRFVAVGNELIPGKWKTFVDFLWAYLKNVLTEDWRKTEARKPLAKQHPILAIFQRAAKQANTIPRQIGEIVAMTPTGDMAMLLHLSYSLYLLQHNVTVQAELVRRIKKSDQFDGAHYEALVAGMLIRAGYNLEFEDEQDVTKKHVELTATCCTTGKKFSVEAKRRQPEKTHFDVGNQLYAALEKPAHHSRLIFIELNMPSHRDDKEIEAAVAEVIASMDSREEKLTIKNSAGISHPAPPAYVVITNHPFSYGPDEPFVTWTAIHGFKIPDLKRDTPYSSIREAYHARLRHSHLWALLKSINEHGGIPSSFDGTPAEIAIEKHIDRLLVGNSYPISHQDGGKEVFATLEGVTVNEKRQAAFGFCKTENGENTIAEFPLTDGELAAYKHYPETFFGQHRPKPPSPNDPVDLYEWFLNSYRHNTKEHFLKLMTDHSDIERLKKLEQGELAEIFCERIVLSALSQKSRSK